MLDLFLQSLLIGVLVTAPLGPTTVIVLQRSLTLGPYNALAFGLGCVVADGVYAALAAFALPWMQSLIGDAGHLPIVGALMLVALGALLLWLPVPKLGGPVPPRNLLRALAAGFVLTIVNPGGLLGFTAGFGSLDATAAVPLFLGGVAGLTLVWLAKALLPRLLRHRVTDRLLHTISRFSGWALIGAGVALFVWRLM
jgi:threonine/homoserine/homoserine lactone efflux protein